MTIGKIWLIFKRMCFSQNYTGMHSIHKNEVKKLKFGLEVPLHGFKKHLEQIFEFLIFLGIWRMMSKTSDILTILTIKKI